MANTYLIVDFKEKDAAKALGARWDGGQRKWFVPDGRELAPFARWLPAGVESFPVEAAAQPGPAASAERGLTIAPKKGMSLSSLLAGVSQAITQAYKVGVWGCWSRL